MPVSAEHVTRDGKVYLRKTCPSCGVSESLVSTDAAAWQEKRDIWQYDEDEGPACNLMCTGCGHAHHSEMVFVDVTNRCNMNCPICIANIPAMGFKFEPPLSYFEAIFRSVSQMDPGPRINLFGGEPTVREDLPDIIELAREYGLRPRIVTNGLRLADEDYCRMITDLKVPLLFSLDGLSADVYDRLRRNPGAFDRKMRALENLKKHSKRRNTIMVCVARHINEDHMERLIRYCHDNRDIFRAMHLIPLTETWEEGEFEADVTTTIEDVERIVDNAFPDGHVDFLSAGLPGRLANLVNFTTSARMTFGGVHPNCESMTYLLSDGEQYRPLGDFTNGNLEDLLTDLVNASLELGPFLSRLNPDRPAHRALGLLRCMGSVGPRLLRFVNWKKLLKGRPFAGIVGIALDLLRGRDLKESLRAHSVVGDVLRMVVLPFEEYHSVESQRLRHCRAAFAYQDPDTEQVGLVPVCAWSLFKKDIQRRIARRYGDEIIEEQTAAVT
jgi:hypothetical protein